MPQSKKRPGAKPHLPRGRMLPAGAENAPWLQDFTGKTYRPQDLTQLVAKGVESFRAMERFAVQQTEDEQRDFPYVARALWHAYSYLDRAMLGWISSGVKNPLDKHGPMAPALKLLTSVVPEYAQEAQDMTRLRANKMTVNPYELVLPEVCSFYNMVRTPALVLPTGIAHEVMTAASGDTADISKLRLPFHKTTLWFDESISVSPDQIRSATTENRRSAEFLQARYGGFKAYADAAERFDIISGISLSRAPDGTLDPMVTLITWDNSGKADPDQLPISRKIYLDLRVDTQLIPSITNLVALVRPQFWTRAHQMTVDANTESRNAPDAQSGTHELAENDYGVRFYELDSTAMANDRQSVPSGRLMPEYERIEHARRQRIGSRQDEIIRWVIVRVEQKRVNEGLDRPVSENSRFYTFPESRDPVEWKGFTEGTVITPDESEPTGYREIEPPPEYAARKGMSTPDM